MIERHGGGRGCCPTDEGKMKWGKEVLFLETGKGRIDSGRVTLGEWGSCN